MKNATRLNEDFTIGAQPGAEDLNRLKEDGFQSIVNLRTPQEQEQERNGQPDPSEERHLTQDLGLNYLHIPVSPENMSRDQVDQFRENCEVLPKPIFVHCKSAMRAGVFAMIHLATANGWSGEETLEKAESSGLEWKAPGVKKFVTDYIDSRNP